MSTGYDPSNSAPGLRSAAVLFLTWALLFYLARIWSKLTKSDRWGMDGTVVSLAMLASIAHVICCCLAISRGYGQGWTTEAKRTDRVAIEKALYASQLFFVTSLGLTRTSTALFTARILTLGQQHRRLAGTIITVCGTSMLALLLTIGLRAPRTRPWKTLDGSQEMFIRWIIVEILGLATDTGTLVFSIIIVWRLQMPIWKRLTVCVLFAIRLLIVPIVAFRLSYLRPSTHDHLPTYSNIGNILTEAELQLFLVLASATCLKPLFQPFHPGFFAVTDSNIAVTGYTNRPGGNGRGEPYYELHGGASRNARMKKQADVHSSRLTASKDDASDQIDLIKPHRRPQSVVALRPSEAENWSSAVAGHNAGPAVQDDPHHIETIRTWAVSYEERNASGF